MGCKQSTPEDEVHHNINMAVGKSMRGVRPSGPNNTNNNGGGRTITTVGATERLRSAQMKQLNASESSKASTNGLATISLEADEETSTRLPKLNANGQLMPDEVVRRTSCSLDVSQISVGTKEKEGGKVIQIQVRSGNNKIKRHPHFIIITMNANGAKGIPLICADGADILFLSILNLSLYTLSYIFHATS